MKQAQISDQNRIAWQSKSYEAWVAAHGTPLMAADDLIRDPKRKLRRILPYLDNLVGQKVANPLGSHGRLAVALALLGAEVTVIDISSSNKRYALELAQAAGVDIRYDLGDFIQIAESYSGDFDQVVMELGIVHYFLDLEEFVSRVGNLLKPGGRLVLNEFHPLLKKSVKVKRGKAILNGDYFSNEIEAAETPYAVFLKDEDIPACFVKYWNLGEIVSAFAQGGFRIEKLVEEPSWDVAELPGTFTLVATRSNPI